MRSLPSELTEPSSRRYLQNFASILVIGVCLLYWGYRWFGWEQTANLSGKTEISECHFLLKHSYVDEPDGKSLVLAGIRALRPSESEESLRTLLERMTESEALQALEAAALEEFKAGRFETHELAVYKALAGMIESLKDPYTIAMDPATFARFQSTLHSQPFGGVGLEIGRQGEEILVFSVLPDTPAATAGIRAGDMLESVEQRPVAGLAVEDVEAMLKGEPGTDVFCRFLRDRQPYSRTLKRVSLKTRSVHARELTIPEGPRIAWISVTGFQDFTGREMGEELARLSGEVDGILLDLRDNVGGYVEAALEVASYFLPSGQTVVEIRSREGKDVKATISETQVALPMLVVVNERTASSAEILSACLQDYGRAKLVGHRTFGKASVQSIHEFSGGGGLKYTTARYRSPKGRTLDGSGLPPDLEMEEIEILEYCRKQWTKKK